MTDSVIDLLIRIKNFSTYLKHSFLIPKNVKFKNVLYVLYKNGLIQSFCVKDLYYNINIRYYFNKSVVSYLKIFSKPSFSTYVSLIDIYRLPSKKFLFFFLLLGGVSIVNLIVKNTKLEESYYL